VAIGRGTVRPGDDVSEARWFDRREIPLRQIAFPSMRRLPRGYLRGGEAPLRGK